MTTDSQFGQRRPKANGRAILEPYRGAGQNSPQGSIQHPALGLTNYRVDAAGDSGTEQVEKTIRLMSEYAEADANSESIRDRAEACKAAGSGCPISGVYDHVRNNLSFVGDEITGSPIGSMYGDDVIEVLIRPVDQETFVRDGMGQGDCDDFSMYAASLLLASGIPCSFVTVAANPQYPDEFSHVYVAAYPEAGGRVALDCSHGAYPGWEYSSPLRIQEWPIGGLGSRIKPALLLAAIAGVAYYYRKDLLDLWSVAA